MHRIVNSVATLASAVTLGAGIWQDWGLLTCLKRMLLAYLGFFFLGAILGLVMLLIPHLEGKDEPAKAGARSSPKQEPKPEVGA